MPVSMIVVSGCSVSAGHVGQLHYQASLHARSCGSSCSVKTRQDQACRVDKRQMLTKSNQWAHLVLWLSVLLDTHTARPALVSHNRSYRRWQVVTGKGGCNG